MNDAERIRLINQLVNKDLKRAIVQANNAGQWTKVQELKAKRAALKAFRRRLLTKPTLKSKPYSVSESPQQSNPTTPSEPYNVSHPIYMSEPFLLSKPTNISV